jgi:hypothetical protein
MQSAEENELPLGRVRRLMKEAAHVRAVTQEASLLVCKATELFLQSLAARALSCKTGEGKLAFADLGAPRGLQRVARRPSRVARRPARRSPRD